MRLFPLSLKPALEDKISDFSISGQDCRQGPPKSHTHTQTQPTPSGSTKIRPNEQLVHGTYKYLWGDKPKRLEQGMACPKQWREIAKMLPLGEREM